MGSSLSSRWIRMLIPQKFSPPQQNLTPFPLLELPPTLLPIVLTFLSLQEHVAVTSLVCKKLTDVLQDHQAWLPSLDFSPYPSANLKELLFRFTKHPLKEIILPRCRKFTDEIVVSLQPLVKTLECLDLTINTSSRYGLTMEGTILLRSLSSLTSLDLCGHRINDEQLALLMTLPLTHLDLSTSWPVNGRPWPFCSESQKPWPFSHKEENPVYSTCRVTDKGLSFLKGSLLRSFHIRSDTITELGIQVLCDLPLERLTIMGGLSFKTSWIWLKNFSLKYLDIGELTDEAASYLKKMPLETLIIQDASRLTEKGFAYLSECPLKYLSLNGLKFSKTGLQALKKFSLKAFVIIADWVNVNTITELQTISIEMLALHGQGLIAKPNPMTTSSMDNLPFSALSLKFLEVSDMGLTKFSKSTHLQHLAIEQCPYITDKGLEVLNSLTTLKTFKVTSCHQVTEKGLNWCQQKQNLKLIYTIKKGEYEKAQQRKLLETRQQLTMFQKLFSCRCFVNRQKRSMNRSMNLDS